MFTPFFLSCFSEATLVSGATNFQLSLKSDKIWTASTGISFVTTFSLQSRIRAPTISFKKMLTVQFEFVCLVLLFLCACACVCYDVLSFQFAFSRPVITHFIPCHLNLDRMHYETFHIQKTLHFDICRFWTVP